MLSAVLEGMCASIDYGCLLTESLQCKEPSFHVIKATYCDVRIHSRDHPARDILHSMLKSLKTSILALYPFIPAPCRRRFPETPQPKPQTFETPLLHRNSLMSMYRSLQTL